ncbi:MAG: septal ring lytic transglycosylase RlpA family protein [Patescibacteria group bacterium]
MRLIYFLIVFLVACLLPSATANKEILAPLIFKSARIGVASWYGPGFHGRKTASGIIFNQNEITVAHRTLPFGTMISITNLINGKTIMAPVLDRGPYTRKNGRYSRDVDLSYQAAKLLGAVEKGVVPILIKFN